MDCLTRMAGGDGRAWELLVRRYQPYLLRLAASYRIGDDAHDAVRNTFLRLLENGAEVRTPEAIKYWLTAAMRHECLLAAARRRRERPTDPGSAGALPLPPPQGRARRSLRSLCVDAYEACA
ncbi:MAG TPA: sigma factor [Actinomycetales bacterium]|nr:sigma factor [Actinomycetales bacterium]